MNDLLDYIFWLVGIFCLLTLIILLIKNKITTSNFFSHLVSTTTIGGFIFTVHSFNSNIKFSERSVQPAIIFFNTGGSVGKDRWSFRNVGKEPALNVVISYRMTDSQEWIEDSNWPLGFPGIASDDKCILLTQIVGPKSLIAEYEDLKGNLWTTIINENNNKITSISKEQQKLKQVHKQQWQLDSTNNSNGGCIGI
ncbi:MAG: hypothetical protein DID91_2727704753 [Candidatus Nitrotoga sp. MKT]|nr:MAG: hypothetical protein DID91_2727704753 [Candidatus Nitrotoga sp. MKT]